MLQAVLLSEISREQNILDMPFGRICAQQGVLRARASRFQNEAQCTSVVLEGSSNGRWIEGYNIVGLRFITS